jgi:hypothetical protein
MNAFAPMPGTCILRGVETEVRFSLGGVAGAGVLYLIATGKEGFTLAAGFAANGYVGPAVNFKIARTYEVALGEHEIVRSAI